MNLRIRPITFKAACAFIKRLHRHHPPPQGCKFAIAAVLHGAVVGVATCGRPVAKESDDGITAEITRVCSDGTHNVCSFLYGRCRRVCQSMGYEKILTKILKEESGVSVRAAGFDYAGETAAQSWDRPSRRRTDKHPIGIKKRFRSEVPA